MAHTSSIAYTIAALRLSYHPALNTALLLTFTSVESSSIHFDLAAFARVCCPLLPRLIRFSGAMSKFQQMKRQQAAALASANNKLPAGLKTSKATIEEDTAATTTATTTTAATSSAVSASTASTGDLARLTSLYPLPVASKADARRRWNLDGSTSSSSSSSLLPSATSSSLLSHRDISFPSGYLTGDYDTQPTSSTAALQKTADLVYQSAMNTALAPGKQLLMTGFMLWMSGNTLQIFSIMMLGMALYQPLQRMLNVQAEFARYTSTAANGSGAGSGVNLLLPQLVFVACNLAGVGLALYKCQSMGLLPTSSADWLSTRVRPAVEFSGGGTSWM